jgi:hypothetical protein
MTLLGLALFAAWLGESERKSIQDAKFKMQTAASCLLAALACVAAIAIASKRMASRAR